MMMGVDALLVQRQTEGRPVRVGIVGAGFMAKGLVNQIVNSTPGMQIVAVCNRTAGRAQEAIELAGATARSAEKPSDIDAAAAAGEIAVTDDIEVLVGSDAVEV